MRTLATMSHEEIAQYMNSLGEATKAVMPPDGLFVLVVFNQEEENLKAHYVSNMERSSVPEMLRKMADSLEKTL